MCLVLIIICNMSILIDLLHSAVLNLESNSKTGKELALIQLKEYLYLKEKGIKDNDDLNKAIKQYRNCKTS